MENFLYFHVNQRVSLKKFLSKLDPSKFLWKSSNWKEPLNTDGTREKLEYDHKHATGNERDRITGIKLQEGIWPCTWHACRPFVFFCFPFSFGFDLSNLFRTSLIVDATQLNRSDRTPKRTKPYPIRPPSPPKHARCAHTHRSNCSIAS